MFQSSIYSKLLKTIVSVFFLLWIIAVFLTREEVSHEIEELFDAQLSQDAGIIFYSFMQYQQQPDAPVKVIENSSFGHKYSSKISFQLWKNKTLVVRSFSAPEQSISLKKGYSDVQLGQYLWRVFVTDKRLNNENYTVVIAEQYEIRDELLEEILYYTIGPLLLILPVLILFLHFAIKRGLSSLPRITKLVNNKGSHDLSAIELNDIPKEIRSVIYAFNQLMHRLKIAFERESRFTMNAAHELRTPLASIKLQAQIAQNSLDNPERLQHALKQLVSGSNKSTHLIEQMLTLARLEPEAIVQKMKNTDLMLAIKKSIAELAPQALNQNISIEFITRSVSCSIRHYPQGIETLLNNLLHNAIKFSPDNDIIRVTLIDNETNCIILIKDNGPGIAEQDIEKVFERHYRSLEEKNKGGCGLGLSIVKQIVTLHQADISLANDNGLLVTIKIPKQSNIFGEDNV